MLLLPHAMTERRRAMRAANIRMIMISNLSLIMTVHFLEVARRFLLEVDGPNPGAKRPAFWPVVPLVGNFALRSV
jgi:hypothetical protein